GGRTGRSSGRGGLNRLRRRFHRLFRLRPGLGFRLGLWFGLGRLRHRWFFHYRFGLGFRLDHRLGLGLRFRLDFRLGLGLRLGDRLLRRRRRRLLLHLRLVLLQQGDADDI